MRYVATKVAEVINFLDVWACSLDICPVISNSSGQNFALIGIGAQANLAGFYC